METSGKIEMKATETTAGKAEIVDYKIDGNDNVSLTKNGVTINMDYYTFRMTLKHVRDDRAKVSIDSDISAMESKLKALQAKKAKFQSQKKE